MTKPKSKNSNEDVLRKPAAKKLGLKINPIGMPHDFLLRNQEKTEPEPLAAAPSTMPEATLTQPPPAQNPRHTEVSNPSYTGIQTQSYTEVQTPGYTRPYLTSQTTENKEENQAQTESYTEVQTPSYTNSELYSSLYSSLYTGSNPRIADHQTQSYTEVQNPLKGKKTKLVAIRLNIDLIELIKSECQQSGETFTVFIESAAIQRLKQAAIQHSNPVYNSPPAPPHDDILMIDDNIIRAHARFAIQPWSPRDDRVGRRFNGTDPRLIDIAMILTVERKLRGNTSRIPIKSFSYFVPELEGLIEDYRENRLPLSLDDYHRYALDAWERRIKPLRDEKWQLNETEPAEKKPPSKKQNKR